MPVNILSDADRDRFNRFPEYIQEEDITAFFTLSDSDKREIDNPDRYHPVRLYYLDRIRTIISITQ